MVFLTALAFYAATASRGIGLPDSAIAIEAMQRPLVSSHACSHNAGNLLGNFLLRVLPGEPVAYRANLVSAVFGATAVACLFVLARRRGLPAIAAWGASGVFLVSHGLWWHSTMVENYALNAVFVLLCAMAASERGGAVFPHPRPWTETHWFLLFLVAGLAVFNHAQNLALVAGALVCLAHRVARTRAGGLRAAVASAAGLACGLAPYTLVLLRDALLLSGSPAAALHAATGGGFRALMFRYSAASALHVAEWAAMQYPSPAVLFAAIGAVASAKSADERPLFLFLGVVAAVNLAFFAGYAVWDRWSFLLPCTTVLAVAAGDGIAWAWRRAVAPGMPLALRTTVGAAVAVSVWLPPALYARAADWAGAGRWPWGERYRDIRAGYADRYDMVGLLLDPIRHDRGTVEQFADLLLSKLPAGALLLDDMSTVYQIEHFRRVDGCRPDLRILALQSGPVTDWGTTRDEAVAAIGAHAARVFLTADTGPCAGVARDLYALGWTARPFALDRQRRVHELLRPPGP